MGHIFACVLSPFLGCSPVQDCLFLTLASFSPLWLKSHYMFFNFSFMDLLTMILLLKERKIIHSPITLILFKTVFVFTLFFLFSAHKLMYSDTIIIIVQFFF